MLFIKKFIFEYESGEAHVMQDRQNYSYKNVKIP